MHYQITVKQVLPPMPDDTVRAILSHIMREWQLLRPMGDAQPPRGIWILAHEPVPNDTRHLAATPVTSAWFGSTNGVHERDVEKVQRLRANAESWQGRPYHRWGWVDLAQLMDEPVYYLEFLWGGLDAYGLQAVVTARGLVLTSAHLWRA